ncbi:MAG: DUF6143 family protein [Paraclostridium dentum]|uniref:Uncharacterized protein n=1 Tax=Paraclostridium bifermentans TaxID=1490 RepID=A0A5P3XD12_PARBF|nr:DUF6143 family protein [Paraclostridium bifermentans]MCU9808572.1 DUF6143 family protein [Paraclostridium sp. AKS46]QEZ68859.1 hypothetical protein D4A35_07890 [Paraclostridium bifermentans]
MTCGNNSFEREISIPYALYQSELGRYFIGQTPALNPTVANGTAIAALVNPSDSARNLFVNVITIKNPSGAAVDAAFYVNSTLPNTMSISNLVNVTNLTINPQPVPYGRIQYLVDATVTTGVSIFSRVVGPVSTEIVDGGQIILPPGQSLVVYLTELAIDSDVVVAFGWWEEYPYTCKYYYHEHTC